MLKSRQSGDRGDATSGSLTSGQRLQSDDIMNMMATAHVTLNRPGPGLSPCSSLAARHTTCRLLIIYVTETGNTQDFSGRSVHHRWIAHFKCHVFDVDKYCTTPSHESGLTYITPLISASLKSRPKCVVITVSLCLLLVLEKSKNDDSNIE
jgi:hypothetical protein